MMDIIVSSFLAVAFVLLIGGAIYDFIIEDNR